MYKTRKPTGQGVLFNTLEDTLNQQHPLYRLANRIDWHRFEEAFGPLYSDKGCPAKPIRRMVGLLILKHVRNVSDESVVEQWQENLYYQYFCGEEVFCPCAPCAASELVHFRHRIGEKGVELILAESIRVNDDTDHPGSPGRGRRPDHEQTAFIDSTVQEKNVTFPTDSKQLNKIIKWCWKIAKEEGITLRQTYAREVKELKRIQRFRGKSHSKKKVRRADSRMRTIAGRLTRELLRTLPCGNRHIEKLDIFLKFINGELYDGHKIYSLHEPDTLCIAKGKEKVKYEFGNKVSIIRRWDGLIIGAMSFRNPYDGHTIEPAMEQVDRIYHRPIKLLGGDRGYRGVDKVGNTKVIIPDVPKKDDSAHQRGKKHRIFRKRAGIEPVIGHCKADHRLSRNFYKGLFGDSINVMLAAAAFNFKRAMRLLFALFLRCRLLCIAAIISIKVLIQAICGATCDKSTRQLRPLFQLCQ